MKDSDRDSERMATAKTQSSEKGRKQKKGERERERKKKWRPYFSGKKALINDGAKRTAAILHRFAKRKFYFHTGSSQTFASSILLLIIMLLNVKAMERSSSRRCICPMVNQIWLLPFRHCLYCFVIS